MTDRLRAALEACKTECVLCPDPDFPSDDCEDCAGQGRYLPPATAELAAALLAEVSLRMTTGKFCRMADHRQGACDCAERNDALLEIKEQLK